MVLLPVFDLHIKHCDSVLLIPWIFKLIWSVSFRFIEFSLSVNSNVDNVESESNLQLIVLTVSSVLVSFSSNIEDEYSNSVIIWQFHTIN